MFRDKEAITHLCEKTLSLSAQAVAMRDAFNKLASQLGFDVSWENDRASIKPASRTKKQSYLSLLDLALRWTPTPEPVLTRLTNLENQMSTIAKHLGLEFYNIPERDEEIAVRSIRRKPGRPTKKNK